MTLSVLILALGANLSFALGSQFFTYFSRKIGSVWVNTFKAIVAQIGFVLFLLITGSFAFINIEQTSSLVASGFIGLGLGDVLLLMSFKEMGPGKTLMLFAFQPLIMGVAGHYIFDQSMDLQKFSALFFFILCLIIFSLESKKIKGHWGLLGLCFAIGGMLLDAAGIVITRLIFDQGEEVTPMLTNFYRTAGALLFFGLYHFIRPIKLVEKWNSLPGKQQLGVSLGAFLGTFLSLTLFLAALQKAHLASLTGISITSAIFSSLIECVWEKRLPSSYLISAFVCFLIGMAILLS